MCGGEEVTLLPPQKLYHCIHLTREITPIITLVAGRYTTRINSSGLAVTRLSIQHSVIRAV